jgi:hypothetical protein
MVDLITPAEYARRRGVSRSAVSKAIKARRIVLIDGLIDPAIADVQWARNSARPRGGRVSAKAMLPAPPPVGASPGAEPLQLLESRSRREAALAELAELELATKRATLVEAAAVERVLAGRIVSVRESLDTLADRITPLLAAEQDPAKVYSLLRAEIRHALAQLSLSTPETRH